MTRNSYSLAERQARSILRIRNALMQLEMLILDEEQNHWRSGDLVERENIEELMFQVYNIREFWYPGAFIGAPSQPEN